MITALLVVPELGSWLNTVVGVQPGDSIDWDSRWSPPIGSAGTIAVTLPGPFEGATRYEVISSCSEGVEHDVAGPPMVIEVSRACVEQGAPDVAAIAYDALGEPLAITSAIDVADTMSKPSITLPAWSSAPIDTTIAIEEVTGEVLVTSHCIAGQVITTSSYGTFAATEGVATFPASAVAACDRVGVGFQQVDWGVGGEELYVERPGLAPTTITRDDRIVSIDAVVSATDPGADEILRVMLGERGVRPNMMWAWIGTNDASTKGWMFGMSGDTTTVPFPELPPELVDSIPPLDALTLVDISYCSTLSWDERRVNGNFSGRDDCDGPYAVWLERDLAVR